MSSIGPHFSDFNDFKSSFKRINKALEKHEKQPDKEILGRVPSRLCESIKNYAKTPQKDTPNKNELIELGYSVSGVGERFKKMMRQIASLKYFPISNKTTTKWEENQQKRLTKVANAILHEARAGNIEEKIKDLEFQNPTTTAALIRDLESQLDTPLNKKDLKRVIDLLKINVPQEGSNEQGPVDSLTKLQTALKEQGVLSNEHQDALSDKTLNSFSSLVENKSQELNSDDLWNPNDTSFSRDSLKTILEQTEGNREVLDLIIEFCGRSDEEKSATLDYIKAIDVKFKNAGIKETKFSKFVKNKMLGIPLSVDNGTFKETKETQRIIDNLTDISFLAQVTKSSEAEILDINSQGVYGLHNTLFKELKKEATAQKIEEKLKNQILKGPYPTNEAEQKKMVEIFRTRIGPQLKDNQEVWKVYKNLENPPQSFDGKTQLQICRQLIALDILSKGEGNLPQLDDISKLDAFDKKIISLINKQIEEASFKKESIPDLCKIFASFNLNDENFDSISLASAISQSQDSKQEFYTELLTRTDLTQNQKTTIKASLGFMNPPRHFKALWNSYHKEDPISF